MTPLSQKAIFKACAGGGGWWTIVATSETRGRGRRGAGAEVREARIKALTEGEGGGCGK